MRFVDALHASAGRRGVAGLETRDPEPFSRHDYDGELAIKRDALAEFWRAARLPGRPDPITAAPVPRGYRTGTKRRAYTNGTHVALAFPGSRRVERGVAPSALDAPEHLLVYAWLARRLELPVSRPLVRALNWTIVRGHAGALTLILNLTLLDAKIVRAAKQLGAALQEASLGVRAAMLYVDPTGSDYYLEARRPATGLTQKRLFGPDWLEVEVGGAKLRFPPTVFSQVNESMVPTMTTTVGDLLGPLDSLSLLDLYCGYGLFSLTVGNTAAGVLGADLAGPAIEAARANAVHLGRAQRARFIAGRIDGEFLSGRLPRARGDEVVVLDPPRQGTGEGVIAALAERSPVRVVHICCGTDEIPRELEAWSAAGYRLVRAVPLDLFPGTAGLETVLLLEPSGDARTGL